MSEPLTLTQSIPLGALPIVSCADTTAPSVFISYSQFSKEHRDWVAVLARKLQGLGVNVTFDANVDGSERFSDFMAHITENKFVICVCSESYVKKIRENPTSGVVWEINQIKARGRMKQPLEQFVIPILKDASCAEFSEQVPDLFWDIPCYNFDDREKSMVSFMTIAGRILSVKKKIIEIKSIISEQPFTIQKISDDIYTALANYWDETLGSSAESQLSRAFLTGEIFNISDLPTNAESIVQEKTDNTPYNEKDINLLGRWDYSCPGDQEILKLLAGDSDDE